MKTRVRFVLKLAGAALALLLVAGLAAPYLNADRYGERLRASLERALGGKRQVEFGKVHFSLFKGPGFSVDSVTIHEDPAIGAEPIAYIQAPGSLEVAPRLWSLLGGRFVIASIRLDGARINLSKSGPASEWGRWNFASFLDRSIMSATPAIHIRDSRINFKFGETKSVFYLTETDLDISPPPPGGAGWRVECSGKAARTDRPAQGLSAFNVRGRWYVAPERLELDLNLDRTGLDEITALMRGQAGGVHGTLSSRLHLAGPLDNIGIAGRLNIEDVHRWDMLPPQGQGGWPLDIRGKLDLIGQQLELETSSARNAPLPIWVHFRASQYLSQPRWGVSINWNKFPVEPIMELARHMGAQFPEGLKLSGSMDGAIGYSGEGGFQGQLGFHDAALTIPGSPPVGFEQAYLVLDHRHVLLSPSVVRTSDREEARIEADYDMGGGTLDLAISAARMKVAALRAQVALAAVPWLEQVRSGEWSGLLHYRMEPGKAGWSGRLELADAEIPVPGMAEPLRLASARAQIDGARVTIDRIRGAAGKVAFSGEYRYDPGAARPHRVRLRAAEVDAAALEAEFLPTLRRSGLIARALGRASVPGWLRERSVDGTLQIDALAIGGWKLENMRARLLWDVARLEVEGIQAMVDGAALSGNLAVNLRGARPYYKLTAKLHGMNWQSGKLDAAGTVETFGSGTQVLANLASQGAFTGSGLDFGGPPALRTVSGNYSLEWWQGAPRLRFTGLSFRTEDEIYTGRGATQDDGRLVVLLSNGARELRMSGTLAKLKFEEVAR